MKLDRRQALFGIGALAAVPMAARAQTGSPELWTRVQQLAEGVINDRLTPGLQISVRRGVDILFEQGFGMANLETATPLTAASVMKIGSVTKQFTAAAMLLLEQDGRLALSDPLARFLPDFPRAADLTLERMLNHTSGLGNYTDTPAFIQNSRTDRSTAELVAAMRDSANLQAHEPGTRWDYSNTAYVLLGAVIEAAAGMPYGQFYQERLFTPFGLTTMAVDDAANVVPGRASGYTEGASGSGFDNASFISMSYPGAAGSIRSTTSDLCRWHGALLGGRILSAVSLQKMLTPARLADGTAPVEGGAPIDYGLGIRATLAGGRALVVHTGGIQGFASYLGTYRAEDLTIATMANIDSGGSVLGPRVRAIREAVRDGLLA